ncbi:hypothetical protein [Citreicoccus inhibens]|nr:hypothetical protein [Citreicoccus inhibens]
MTFDHAQNIYVLMSCVSTTTATTSTTTASAGVVSVRVSMD